MKQLIMTKHHKLLKKKSAFTLIEVMMAMALFAMAMGSILQIISSSIKARKNANELSKAIIIARQKMNEIRMTQKEVSEEGEVEITKGNIYKFSYFIKEVEVDINSLMGGGSDSSEKSMIDQYLEDRSLSSETVTGLSFKILHYKVKVFYANNKEYEVDFFRGLGTATN